MELDRNSSSIVVDSSSDDTEGAGKSRKFKRLQSIKERRSEKNSSKSAELKKEKSEIVQSVENDEVKIGNPTSKVLSLRQLIVRQPKSKLRQPKYEKAREKELPGN